MSCEPNSEIRFACQPGCRKCCEVSGYVYLTENDVANAAGFLGMPQPEFEAAYIFRTRHIRRIRKPRGKARQCPFLTASGCGIHPVKPVQCRLFPFWPELVEAPREWQRTAEWCPGIGQGELIQIGTALEMAQEMRAKYPETYE